MEAQIPELCSSMSTVCEEAVENFYSSSAYCIELTMVTLEFFGPARDRGFQEGWKAALLVAAESPSASVHSLPPPSMPCGPEASGGEKELGDEETGVEDW